MYHSVYFGEMNTWDDWHLVPETRPVINPPAPKINKIDVPGSDGSLDITNALNEYTNFENRTGSLEFIVVNDLYYQNGNHEEWYVVYSNIMNYLHGKRMVMILEDDRQYYYFGRFSVNTWKSDKQHSKITIDYDVEPYKWNVFSSLDDWLWDPFNFVTGVIPDPSYRNRDVESWTYDDEDIFHVITNWQTMYINARDLGPAPICPTIYAKFDNTSPITGGAGNKIESAMMFKIPGYEEPRVYTWKALGRGIQIPELTFREDMDTAELKIEYATRCSQRVLASTTHKCPVCDQINYALFDIISECPTEFSIWRCRNCNSLFPEPYDPDPAHISVEIREGRL